MTRYRRAGSRWRLLVHNMAADGRNGVARTFKSHPDEGGIPRRMRTPNPEMDARMAEIQAQHGTDTIIPGAEFDELVVGRWCHIEQMDTGYYWMDIAGVVLRVRVDRDGRPTSVLVEHEPVDGVTYHGEIGGPP